METIIELTAQGKIILDVASKVMVKLTCQDSKIIEVTQVKSLAEYSFNIGEIFAEEFEKTVSKTKLN